MSSFFLTIFRVVQSIFCASPSQNEKPQPPEVIVTAPSPQTERPEYRRPYTNDNAVNQENEQYKELRARARQEGDTMAKCFEESHTAYQSGDGARAKQLSDEGHEHQRKMNEFNSQASEWIFRANNLDSALGEVDLHGLFVKEAISYTEKAIQAAQARGDRQIRLIVGKGLHSTNHVAKLKPAIEELIQRYNLATQVDENNSGVLIVTLDGDTVPQEGKLDLNDIVHRIEKQDRECIIM